MRRAFNLILLLLGLNIAFTSCEREPKPVPVTDVTLNTTSLTLIEGESAMLIATISPSNADNQAVIWSSSNGSIASVSNGTVKALAAGTAIITAKSDDGWKTAQCSITVKSRNAIIISGSENLSPSFDSDGGKKTISFTSVGGPWSAEFINGRADGWCNISPSSGSEGQASLTITAAPNTDFDERNASIVIKCGDSSKTVTVSQKQKDDITATKSKFELPSEGGSIEIEVKSNVNYSYSTNCDWITIGGTKAYESKKLTFNISRNDSVTKREGEITFTSGNLTETVKVYQDGEQPTIVLTQNEYTIGSDGGSIKVEVRSNVDVTMEIPSDITWLKESTTKSVSTSTFYLIADKNSDVDSRTASVKFTNAENGLSETVTITQAQMDVILMQENELEFGWKEDSQTIKINTNIDINYIIPTQYQGWLQIDALPQTKGLESHEYSVHVKQNNSIERDAYITFSNGNFRDTLWIKQSSYPLILEESQLTADCLKGATVTMKLSASEDWAITDYTDEDYSISQTSGTPGKYEIIFSMNSANCTNEDRIFNLNIESDGELAGFKINQIPAFKFDSLNWVIPASGGKQQFTFTFPRKDYSSVKTYDYDNGFLDMINNPAYPSGANDYFENISYSNIYMLNMYMAYTFKPNFTQTERYGKFKLSFTEGGQTLTSEWVYVTQGTSDNYSQDYSSDGTVKELFTHTKGSGVPVVIMGDGFTDKDIANGTYDNVMKKAAQYFFSAEPIKSLQDYYDVWSITAVSPSSTFDGLGTRFCSTFGSGTHIDGDDNCAYNYAAKIVPSSKRDDMLIIIVMNSKKYAGTCYLHYYTNYSTGKYSLSYSVAYVPMSDQSGMTFEDVIHHEACGHGFGKLADEYSNSGTIPSSERQKLAQFQAAGAYTNVDTHSDVQSTLWSQYANDSRFSAENLGAYEGAYTYSRGVYRPTITSIMVSNKGIFNAPSRAQIYSRVMSISNNWNWDFDYESFVKFDEHIRSIIYSDTSNSSNAKAMNIDSENYIPLAPPVFVLDN